MLKHRFIYTRLFRANAPLIPPTTTANAISANVAFLPKAKGAFRRRRLSLARIAFAV
jgi:hypothetical protein